MVLKARSTFPPKALGDNSFLSTPSCGSQCSLAGGYVTSLFMRKEWASPGCPAALLLTLIVKEVKISGSVGSSLLHVHNWLKSLDGTCLFKLPPSPLPPFVCLGLASSPVINPRRPPFAGGTSLPHGSETLSWHLNRASSHKLPLPPIPLFECLDFIGIWVCNHYFNPFW